MYFYITLITVAIMLAYSLPGFIFIKSKAIKPESISAFAKLLLYVCQPSIFFYSFNKANFSLIMLKDMGIYLGLCFAIQILMLFVMTIFFYKSYADVRNRICAVASVFANVSFFGIPLLEALLPNYPQAIIFSAVFAISMNVLVWTLGLSFISWDKTKINVKRVLLNPPMISLAIILPLFFTSTKLPIPLASAFELLGRMTTPLCMLILGMRLATVKIREMFSDWKVYVSTFIKGFIYPLVAFCLVFFTGLPFYIKATFFILCSCPSASMVLNMSELIGVGQKYAANSVLVSTLSSILTIPIMVLLVNLL